MFRIGLLGYCIEKYIKVFLFSPGGNFKSNNGYKHATLQQQSDLMVVKTTFDVNLYIFPKTSKKKWDLFRAFYSQVSIIFLE